MGAISRMAMGAALHVGSFGTGVAKAYKQSPPKMDVLSGIVERAAERGQLSADQKTSLQELVDKNDRQGLTAALHQLADEGAITPSQIRALPPVYTSDDVQQMRGAAEDVLAVLGVQLDKLEAIVPKKVKTSTLDSLTGQAREALEMLDAKYKNASPDKLRSRMQEVVVSTYFTDLTTKSDKQLRAVGLDDDQITLAQEIRKEQKAAKKDKGQTGGRIGEAAGKLADLAPELNKIGSGGRLDAALSPDALSQDALGQGTPTADKRPSLDLELGGFSVAEKLGVDVTAVPEDKVQVMLDQSRELNQKLADLTHDAITVYRGHHKTMAKIGVDIAQIRGVEPERFLKSMTNLQQGIEAAADVMMLGRDTASRIMQLDEVHDMVTLVVDQLVMEDGPMKDRLVELAKQPAFETGLLKVMNSDALAQELTGLKAALDGVLGGLGRLS